MLYVAGSQFSLGCICRVLFVLSVMVYGLAFSAVFLGRGWLLLYEIPNGILLSLSLNSFS